ncbi:MAG: ribbon-helix-helix domain-containing protein [Thermoproteota archaeon]
MKMSRQGRYSTIRLPGWLIEEMDRLVESGEFKSRADILAHAVNYFEQVFKPVKKRRKGKKHVSIPMEELNTLRRLVRENPQLETLGDAAVQAVVKMLRDMEKIEVKTT